MASKRNLKKGIREISEFLAEDIFFLYGMADAPALEKLDELLFRVCELENETLNKVGKKLEKKGEARSYYCQLIDTYNEKIEAIEAEMLKLLPLNKKEEVRD